MAPHAQGGAGLATGRAAISPVRHRLPERATVGAVDLRVEVDREEDGRWMAEISALPGVIAYGSDRTEAIRAVQAKALQVLADRLVHGELAGGDAWTIAFSVQGDARP